MAQSVKFQLNKPPETENRKVAVLTDSSTGSLNPIAFGQGVLRPFTRDGKGDWANASDITLVRSEVGQVLGTLASSGSTNGELPWRPEFGSLLPVLRYRNLDATTAEIAKTYVIDALKKWLFRVVVTNSKVVIDFDSNALIISVKYNILARNKRSVISAGNTSSIVLSMN